MCTEQAPRYKGECENYRLTWEVDLLIGRNDHWSVKGDLSIFKEFLNDVEDHLKGSFNMNR